MDRHALLQSEGRKSGRSALHTAARIGDVSQVMDLLQQGYCVSSPSRLPADKGGQALHLAASGGHWRVIDVLLRKRANPNASDLNGFRPLHKAAWGGSVQVVKLLQAYGATMEAQDKYGLHATHLAARNGHVQILKLLQSYRCNLESRDHCSATPLHHAAQHCKLQAVEWLIRVGVAHDIEDDEGKTAADHAKERNCHQVVAVLNEAISKRSRQATAARQKLSFPPKSPCTMRSRSPKTIPRLKLNLSGEVSPSTVRSPAEIQMSSSESSLNSLSSPSVFPLPSFRVTRHPNHSPPSSHPLSSMQKSCSLTTLQATASPQHKPNQETRSYDTPPLPSSPQLPSVIGNSMGQHTSTLEPPQCTPIPSSHEPPQYTPIPSSHEPPQYTPIPSSHEPSKSSPILSLLEPPESPIPSTPEEPKSSPIPSLFEPPKFSPIPSSQFHLPSDIPPSSPSSPTTDNASISSFDSSSPILYIAEELKPTKKDKNKSPKQTSHRTTTKKSTVIKETCVKVLSKVFTTSCQSSKRNQQDLKTNVAKKNQENENRRSEPKIVEPDGQNLGIAKKIDDVDGKLFFTDSLQEAAVMNLQVHPAQQPYPDGADTYFCSTNPRGHVLILNIRSFADDDNLTRFGSECDITNLENVYHQMGYKVTTRWDLSRADTLEFFSKESQSPLLRHVSCLFVFIMSHGDGPRTFLTHDQKTVSLDEVLNFFLDKSCPDFKGKPKIFFNHFCRGQDEEIRSTLFSEAKREAYKDMLCIYSSTSGFQAYRDRFLGTPSVRAFCQALARHAHDKMLHEVIKEFQSLYEKMKGATSPEVQNLSFVKYFFLNPTGTRKVNGL